MADIEIKKTVEEETIKEGDKEITKREETVVEKIEGIGEEIKEKEEKGREEEIIEERKKKVIGFFKKFNLWVLAFLIIAILLGVYIRSMPMFDHGGNPGLWDITTNTWTLGPDLDPWLFLRYAKTIVEQGSLPEIDHMRNVPLGFDPSTETRLLPYMIVGTYWVFHLFGSDVSIEFAGVIFPVIMFVFTIIVFFLFVREIFVRESRKSKTRANIIALISTFFMVVIPVFLSRTIAGIPEKESAAFFFMFLTFYLFLKAWKSESLKKAVIIGTLSGISTALMGLIWGGVSYVFVTISMMALIAFILNKVHKKEFLIYLLWILFSFSFMVLFSKRFPFKGMVTSLDSGLAVFVLLILIVHFALWGTKLKGARVLEKVKLPKNILSLIVGFVLIVIIASIFFGPGFIIEKFKALNQIFFRPITGRWVITVAENRQPYFTEWGGSFGPFIKNIPVLLWLFFAGSVILFKNMLSKIKKKDAWILTILYILFFFGLVFSRYSGSSILNGDNFISRLFYYSFALLLIGSFIYYYLKYYKEGNRSLEEIDDEFLFLFSLFVLCLFTARSAVRLIMVLAPIAPIFLAYLIVESTRKFKKTEDDTAKIIFAVLAILIIVLSIFIFWNFYKNIKGQAYGFVPSSYSQQWQKAMYWVRENTPENAVFGHWWDYGYWVQSIGERATVLDGANVIVYWNYLMGRHVLTGDNEKDALEFLYNHNTTHLLIDSTDIGKYTAFSSIGSDENYDKYSWVPIMLSDEKNTQETRTGTIRVYQGGSLIDEDIVYKENEAEIFLPAQKAAIIGVTIEITKSEEEISFQQPEAVFYYQGIQHKIPLRYIYYNNEFFDYESGLETTVFILQRVYQANQGIGMDSLGALMYLSPRLMRGLLVQKYILNDPFNNFPNFQLVHSEPGLMIDSLNSQGMDLNEFIYYQGVQGPIKIWEIKYTGEEKIKEEYLDRDYSEYIDWTL